MNDIYEEIEHIKRDIEVRVKHPYLMEFIDVPIIDEQKLFLLYSILKETELPAEKIKSIMVATMLVQIALDTHELVGLRRIDDHHPFMKKRQLTVLAGDYYSGLYYYLLSQVEDLQMIRVLSTAIKEINEHKISIYQNDLNDLDDFIDRVAMVDSLLIQKIATYFGNIDLKNLAKEYLLANRLNNEKINFSVSGLSVVIDKIRLLQEKNERLYAGVDRNQALALIEKQMMKSVHYLETFLKHHKRTYCFLSEKIRDFINRLDLVIEKAVKEG
ncbi:heptaprenyl diphosphate synthase component 1 [Calidifontibacillus erzurumensis]|uniref:Heptaprenyl diphosphate synthase component 1 n=1 Tax=Calidifontibacillus erzurumensis TaxID=2741433 RepID=A0A8J8KBT9_9BACI|nr:heptaprenyl diphosphate synthase component 1 [Calidifontibacillus erzurumensis]NSL52299.1 heptaprenyl diphosphate synthase component 1 [Calidifontibacillus erzurumensis]